MLYLTFTSSLFLVACLSPVFAQDLTNATSSLAPSEIVTVSQDTPSPSSSIEVVSQSPAQPEVSTTAVVVVSSASSIEAPSSTIPEPSTSATLVQPATSPTTVVTPIQSQEDITTITITSSAIVLPATTSLDPSLPPTTSPIIPSQSSQALSSIWSTTTYRRKPVTHPELVSMTTTTSRPSGVLASSGHGGAKRGAWMVLVVGIIGVIVV